MKGKSAERFSCDRRYFIKLATGSVAGVILMGADAPLPAFADNAIVSASGGGMVVLDSLDRSVEVPLRAVNVAPSGGCAQSFLLTLCPEKLSSLAVSLSGDEIGLYSESGKGYLVNLPVAGEVYPRVGDALNVNAILSAEPEILVDAGFSQENLAAKLDELELRTHASALFVDASFGCLPSAYRALGSVLGCEGRAESLAAFVERVFGEIEQGRGAIVDLPKVLFAGGASGFSSRNEAMIHDVIRYAGGNPIAPRWRSVEGSTNSTMVDSADIVIFNDRSCYEAFAAHTGDFFRAWLESECSTVGGSFAVSPSLFYRWIGSALTTQTVGLAWLANLIHPEVYHFDLGGLAREFYDLFFGYELNDDQLEWFDL